MSKADLKLLSDEALYQETGDRLRKSFFREHGRTFQFGSFEFVFHRGALQWIEERPKYRRFVRRITNNNIPSGNGGEHGEV